MSEEKLTLSDGKEAAPQQILDLVAEYCDKYHNQKKEFTEGQRISFAIAKNIFRRFSACFSTLSAS